MPFPSIFPLRRVKSSLTARRSCRQVSLGWASWLVGLTAVLLSCLAAPAQVIYSGQSIPSRPTVPADSIGVENAWYLDLTTGNVFGPKTLGTWPSAPVATFPIEDANGNLTILGTMTAGAFSTPQPTVTLSGSTVPTPQLTIRQNLAGSSTLSGNTSLADFKLLKSGDNAAVPNGSYNEFLINTNYGGTTFSGGRIGLNVQMGIITASTVSAQADGLVGFGSKVRATVNAGGQASGFGITQRGLGSLYGSNPWCDLFSGATYYTNCIGEEVDISMRTGSSASILTGLQVILTSAHAVQGTNVDTLLRLGAQVGASAGIRNAITIGDYLSQWPVDANGYLLQAQYGNNNLTNPSTAAGGIDLLQATFSGTGNVGGGFAFRTNGMQIGQNGRVQTGYGLLDGTSGGLTISASEQTLSGTPTVASGGSNWNTGTIAGDAYGNLVQIASLSGDAVATVTVLRRGWNTSPPPNPVTFNALTIGGSGIGQGLTLNETWAGSANIALGSGSDVVSLPVVSTGTPTASLCLDASNHIIKKTTAGSCI